METSWEKKNNTNKRLRWGHIFGMKKKLQNMKDDEATKNKRFIKRYVETSLGKKKTNKRLRWGHILGMKKKWLNDIDETKDLQRDKWRHLERKKITQTKD